ncbi:hypothetical protein [Aliiruegeria lutimaris]|uniref:Uncharacterized protein n=1 Tax=Aliiruegeria lutimaris TaxID=571298 RepID=A0A1G9CDJ5_9RHOB|nr:hypothetical protein SAMN04488026_104311 [Aliiruegeria lutimaris]
MPYGRMLRLFVECYARYLDRRVVARENIRCQEEPNPATRLIPNPGLLHGQEPFYTARLPE